uniref:excalibur calcium-binding domain-containing protein n=1 Tax=Microbacterium sp. SORGH_AS_1204 TaxID=3041785 RepID=UPI0027D7E19E|nr:excalibur calcium-binding domain-containing protein [Microbacterium sp. SORGH_AS_1204]
MKRRTGAIMAGSALALGLLVGGASAGAGTQAELNALKAHTSVLEADIAAAQDQVDVSAADLASATASNDAMLKERDSATARVTELEAAATAARTELDARAATIADLQGKVAAQSGTTPAAEAEAPKSPTSVSYKNCTAAREAGAAPVRRGDPGYGSHLDRDGDGVGCE